MADLTLRSRRDILAASVAIGILAAARPALAESGAGGIVAAAKTAIQRHGGCAIHRDVVAVADFSRASGKPRLHLVDLVGGRVDSLLVAHGRGSDPARTGWLSRFSNDPGSDCTSEGAYLVGDDYVGEHGRSLRLAGLEHTNCNAEARAIVIHPAWYVSSEIARAQGMLGRSQGCFAVSQADAPRLLNRLAPGHLLVATRL